MNRWRVFRYKSAAGWTWTAGEVGRTGVILLSRSELFATWREAMEYADRMARTWEVVLPRQTIMPTSRHIVHKNGLIIEWVQNQDFPSLSPKYLTVKTDELRPLALALLARAEKENA